MTLEPATPQELAEALAGANAKGESVSPQGGGTKSAWGNPGPAAAHTLSTLRLNRVLEHAWADMTVTVEAGCTVEHLQAELARHGQRLACDPLWPDRATIGGILATNDSGPLRLRFGGLRDLVIGITVALADGTLAASGGKVVKNVAGYDLPKLMTGALGTLGVITQAVFRLHPLPRQARSLTIAAESLDAAQRVILAILNSQLAPSAVQLRAESGRAPAIDVLLEGVEAGVAAQESAIRTLAAAAQVTEAGPATWSARERLWPGTTPIVKFTCLPSQIQASLEALAAPLAVVQAHGIGYATLADEARIPMCRKLLETRGGSLTVIMPTALTPTRHDAWGSPGDALPLMRALKQQLDSNGILNPGRFVGGI